MYRITAPRAIPDTAARSTPEVRIVLVVLALMALALLSYYVHVLQDQVLRGQQFREDLRRSSAVLAAAPPPGRAAQVTASRR